MSTGLSILSERVVEKQKIKKSYGDLWPEQYINKDTGKVWSARNEDEHFYVFSNTPARMLLRGGEGSGKTSASVIKTLNRLRDGMSGICGCVAAETLVNGIPIADYKVGGKVNTLLGRFQSSPSYLKGKADLFRVRLQSGHEVVVTKYHRFLTPNGWRYLYQLGIGDQLVVHGSDHDLIFSEIQLNYEDGYLSNLHQYDELSNQLERHNQDKLTLPFLQELYHSDYAYFGDHVYKNNYLSLLQKHGASQENDISNDISENVYMTDYIFHKVLSYLCQEHTHSAWFQFLYSVLISLPPNLESVYPMLIDYFLEELLSLSHPNSRQFDISLLPYNPYQTFLLSCYNHTFFENLSCLSPSTKMCKLNYNIVFSTIQDIKFENYGEFYDMNVPGIGHYEGNGIIHHNSPTLPHLIRSLWPEFCRWCPPNVVIEKHRHRLKADWKPSGSFQMVFYNKYGGFSTLECGGFIENQMGYWEGPTVSFVWGDEIRQHKTPIALKTFEGRVRMPGPMQEPPQIYFSTTPRKHWLYDYFGPLQKKDKYADFKKDMFCGVIPVELNKDNLSEGYIEKRKQSLTAAEIRVLMNAEWEDTSDVLQFIQSEWWNPGCYRSDIPSYNKEPCVCAIDASKGRESSKPDNAALVVVSTHPTEPNILVPRYVKVWDFEAGQEFDYSLLTEEIKIIQNMYSIIEYAYDSYQLAYWAQQMRMNYPAYYREFGQEKERLLADSALQQRIMSQAIYHDGNKILFEHLKNANCKKYRNDEEESRFRIRMVKKHNSGKIDAGVALSMAAFRMAHYNVV